MSIDPMLGDSTSIHINDCGFYPILYPCSLRHMFGLCCNLVSKASIDFSNQHTDFVFAHIPFVGVASFTKRCRSLSNIFVDVDIVESFYFRLRYVPKVLDVLFHNSLLFCYRKGLFSKVQCNNFWTCDCLFHGPLFRMDAKI